MERARERQEVILIRHGQSTANASGVWQGQMEFPLSPLGRLQAAEAGRALKGTKITGVYSSPLARAFETAEIVAREAGFSRIIPVPGLAERHGGALEGRTWAEQEAHNPAFAEKFLALPEEERWSFAGAETDEEILERFEKAVRDILGAGHHTTDSSLVVVSHGGVMRAFLRDLFGPTVLPGAERTPNASITRLLFDPADPEASPQLLELASTDHLPRERTTMPETPGAIRDAGTEGPE